jgi:hypothetical protein
MSAAGDIVSPIIRIQRRVCIRSPKLFLLTVLEVQDHCGSPTLRVRYWKHGAEHRLTKSAGLTPMTVVPLCDKVSHLNA